MTIETLKDTFGRIGCQWFDEKKTLQHGSFVPAMLEEDDDTIDIA